MAKIIYLNGPSSSGKSTLAKALQDSFEEPFLHVGIDKIIAFMPEKLNNWEGGDAPLGFCWKPDVDPTGHLTYHIHAGPFAKKITRLNLSILSFSTQPMPMNCNPFLKLFGFYLLTKV